MNLAKTDLQFIEMYLNVIINEASNMSSGNVSHKAANIKGHANAIKERLSPPKYKCNNCKDTGTIPSEEYRGHTEGFVPIEKTCSCGQ